MGTSRAFYRIYGENEKEKDTARRRPVLKRVPRTRQASPAPVQQHPERAGEMRVRQAQARPCARPRASAVHPQRTCRAAGRSISYFSVPSVLTRESAESAPFRAIQLTRDCLVSRRLHSLSCWTPPSSLGIAAAAAGHSSALALHQIRLFVFSGKEKWVGPPPPLIPTGSSG